MTELVRDADWRRLDARMLLVHPVTELVRFLPLLVGVVVLGQSSDGNPWAYLGVAVPIAVGLWRFASTSFRITAGQIELRRGLLSRSVLTAPLDRVRTVELTASPIHRILGLAKVEIGTGSASKTGESQLVLDSLGVEEGRRLRADLLHHAPLAVQADGPTGSPVATEPATDRVIVRLDPSWIRFAPLTTSGVVIALAALGAGTQVLDSLIERAARSSELDDQVRSLPLAVTIPAAVVVFALVVSVLAIAGYVLANWGFTLSRDSSGRSYHVRRGLLTTRETSIDVERLRGVEVHEPLGLRVAGGGRATAVVTGLGRSAEGSAALVPPAPRPVVLAVGEHVLGEAGALTTRLTLHGPAARRRRYTRALAGTALVPAALVSLVVVADWPVWPAVLALLAPVAGLLLARDRYAGLGHALTDRHLVVRSGSLQGRRDTLQRTGIIGWNIEQSWFQRRAGLCTLTATTAAGKQAYRALDIPEPMAVSLADRAVPGLLADFVE